MWILGLVSGLELEHGLECLIELSLPVEFIFEGDFEFLGPLASSKHEAAYITPTSNDIGHLKGKNTANLS